MPLHLFQRTTVSQNNHPKKILWPNEWGKFNHVITSLKFTKRISMLKGFGCAMKILHGYNLVFANLLNIRTMFSEHSLKSCRTNDSP